MINLLSQITANYFLAKPRAIGIYVKMEVREHIFVPLGNGTLFLGVVFGLEHLLASGVIEKMPKVIAIQSVATEYGIANLSGKTLRERAESMIAIAHPDFRDELEQYAKEAFH